MSLSKREKKSLKDLSVRNVLKDIKYFSEHAIKNDSGNGKGTVAAGTIDEHKLGQIIKKKMEKIGLDVKLESFPVQKYTYEKVKFEANNVKYDAVSLWGAGGTYGKHYGAKFFLGNTNHGKTVTGELIDGGTGKIGDNYTADQDLTGKIVIIKRQVWPTYEITEAYNRGALALIVYGYDVVLPEYLKQDVMYNHLQLPVISVSEDTYNILKNKMDNETVTVSITNKMNREDGKSYNVVGTLKGCKKPKGPDDYILVSAHYDRWFKAAADNCSGIAGMLELARFTKENIRSDKTFIFMAVAAEEGGIYNSTWDWLSGSTAFVKKHYDVMRNLWYGINLDIYGWTNNKSLHEVSLELIPFHENTIAQLDLGDFTVEIIPYENSNVDSWVYSRTGGGPMIFPGTARLFSDIDQDPEFDYQKYYHTNGDVYVANRFVALKPELTISAAGLILAAKAKYAPMSYTTFNTALGDVIAAQQSTVLHGLLTNLYDELNVAFDEFKDATEQVEMIISNDPCGKADQINKTILSVRKEYFPWLYALTPFRLTLYNSTFNRLGALITSIQNADPVPDILAAFRTIGYGDFGSYWSISFGKLDQFLPKTFADERMFYYATNDWLTTYDQKARIISEQFELAYFDIRDNNADPTTYLDLIVRIQNFALGNASEAITITKGRLREATETLKRYILDFN